MLVTSANWHLICLVISIIDRDDYQFCLAKCENKYQYTKFRNSMYKYCHTNKDLMSNWYWKTNIYIYIYICVCVCVCIYVCIYIYIYIYIYIFTVLDFEVEIMSVSMKWQYSLLDGNYAYLISITEKQTARHRWNDIEREKLNYLEKNLSYFIHLPPALYIILAIYSDVKCNFHFTTWDMHTRPWNWKHAVH